MAYDFDLIARRYDRMNHLMTCYTDVLWRRRAVRSLLKNRNSGRYLDVATGTGDMAKAILQYAGSGSSLVGVDLSRQMLKLAKKKLEGLNCELLQADAECLPFEDGSFDGVSVSFGVRNFVHLQQGLSEMCRVLKPGGRLVLLELSYPDNSFLLSLYKLYACKIIPWVGGIVSGDRKAYEYLPASILKFPKQDGMNPLLKKAGFSQVKHSSMTFGVCRMYVCEKVS